MFFLDTNICIYFLNGKYENIVRQLTALKPSDIKIPTIVEAELFYGVENSMRTQENRQKLEAFLAPFERISFDSAAAKSYGKLRASLKREGKVLGPNDLLIASLVLSKRAVLVTHNVNEFSQVNELSIQDWCVV
jgi:tRNA(fMet)-specific endonuclease VapC